ncbi:Putative auto-transporter adhesin, head GIN domain [Hymenobacter daecheongensis DSM 21074]|uniref:Putative auto-transporter adhesin, head GIN domain n=1 Tax=Hymenobacter daecheongensis DSM 21074 TaxID=1121955 RepID=A0A1M6A0C0_9BACT|nr:head GIN domain-containing protein [Hymenobacter daecheongensis]SHI29954.1 Putative auto-transporter adhesin, head GIN domain [Hymenobacter daecheongensis DSM 21074]
MKTLLSSALLALSLLLSGCHDHDIFPDRISGSGPVEAENRAVSAFNRVDLAIDGTVYLTQGTPASVRVEAQRNVLEVLQTSVSGEKLSIGFGRVQVRRHEPIRVYITTPNLQAVAVAGSGELQGKEGWQVQDLDLALSGSGSIGFDNITARDLDTDISGSGTVRLSGAAHSHSVDLSGSGKVEAYGLRLQTADVRISGSGACYLTASEALRATISGSGNIYYRGRPAVTVRVSGSGRVVDAN